MHSTPRARSPFSSDSSFRGECCAVVVVAVVAVVAVAVVIVVHLVDAVAVVAAAVWFCHYYR